MSKSKSTRLDQHLKEQITNHFSETAFFIVGVSGGADSMALCYALSLIEAKALIVHVNYQLRGNASDLDQELVEQMATEWGFEALSVRLTYNPDEDGNLQAWARDQRYQIFRDMVREYKADAIITAHHRDDQIETILQKLFRGSAPDSWQGMLPLENELFRPLLDLDRVEIMDYVKDHAIPFREDESNLQTTYARNALRILAKPELEQLFPGWDKNILKLSDYGMQNQQLITSILDQLRIEAGGIDTEKLKTWPDHIQQLVMKEYVEADSQFRLSRGQIEELAKWKDLSVGKKIELGDGVSLHMNRNELKLSYPTDQIDQKISKEEITQSQTIAGFNFNQQEKAEFEKGLNLDFDQLKYPLQIRNWRSGDRFQPLGFEGSQKVSDHLTNRKISSSEREKSLVLTGSDSTIYAILFPGAPVPEKMGSISDQVKCTEKSQRYLLIRPAH